MEGDAGYLEVLLGAENLVDFLTRMDRLQAIRESHKAIIRNLNQNKSDLVLAQDTLATAKELQVKTIGDLEAAIMGTKDMYSQKMSLLEELNKNESEAIALYEYYKRLDEELNAELQNYLAELQRKQQSLYIGGSMAWPLDSSAYYYYSSEFGWRTLWGQADYHLGLDIACAQNTKIFAANGGTVLKSEEHWSYGNYVLIDHGGGMATLYAHMTRRAVSVGDTVSIGQVIGYVGSTGNSTGNHLHFEVRKNGEVQQPRNYIVGPND
jgi:murein DD-endopeptidase MepM/ murein hydrolase activator NlpD